MESRNHLQRQTVRISSPPYEVGDEFFKSEKNYDLVRHKISNMKKQFIYSHFWHDFLGAFPVPFHFFKSNSQILAKQRFFNHYHEHALLQDYGDIARTNFILILY